MFDLDKAQFGAFCAQRRKALGMTQKALAEKLFVSDKAVSKWERGLSLPDTALLLPLARTLGVTVTELLEGRELPAAQLDAEQVETIVQKALGLSAMPRPRRKLRQALAFGGFVLAGCLILGIALWRGVCGVMEFGPLLLVMGAAFGLYFWVFAPERLPDYYDENAISVFADGPFRMNLPGVRFHNRNWPHIVKTARWWCAAVVSAGPLAVTLLAAFVPGWERWGTALMLLLTLGGLFVPMFLAAKKYA